ncbi:MAG: sensor domain-containing diguanylate cyclase [Isosphaeraceae bacterium]
MQSQLHAGKVNPSNDFFRKVMDSMASQIAVLADDGTVVAVNRAWQLFAVDNGLGPETCGPGSNYLRVCDLAEGGCSEEAAAVARGIREVLAGDRGEFSLEYPCHSPFERRWFRLRVSRVEDAGRFFSVVLHENVTTRKLAELALQGANEQLRLSAMTDALTGVANRRAFEHRLEAEWRRLARERDVLALALIDIDCFKLYNDSQGHVAGDACLRQVAQAIASGARRPADFVARYGGEEFAVVLPLTDEHGAATVTAQVIEAVRKLGIPHPASRVGRGCVTLSAGVSAMRPSSSDSPKELVHLADAALYQAKRLGRDQLVRESELKGVGVLGMRPGKPWHRHTQDRVNAIG